MRTQDPPHESLLAFWMLPFQLAAGACRLWLDLLATHHLSPEERDDKAHGQLVVPEPLRREEDHDLFA